MTIETLSATLKANPDGATIDPFTYQPRQFRAGYAVSLTDNIFRELRPRNLAAAVRALRVTASRLQLDRWYIGYWYDTGRRVHCLDLSLVLENKRQALAIGRTFKQAAIFNFQTMAAIPC
jgi:hypothetical protein